AIFLGRIEGFETRIYSQGERVEILARDFGSQLKGIAVYGQRVCDADGTTVFLDGMDTVFNPQGQGNASIKPAENNGRGYTVFGADGTNRKLWSGAEAIFYLLCEYLPEGRLGRPSLAQLEALTEEQSIRDLDVTGLNLADALGRCCGRLGVGFRFVPWPAAAGPREAIVFYRNGSSRAVELNCQGGPGRLSISKTDVVRLHSVKSLWPVTHKYIGQGDFKVYEGTFDLVKAWDGSDEGTDYDKYSCSSNAEFHKVQHVYRKWCLNEGGDYSGSPYDRGEAFDFSRVFEGGAFARRRRRFWPATFWRYRSTTVRAGGSTFMRSTICLTNAAYG
ncbi:MAG: hypothetical protein ACYS29_18715, partial [Planctomycetota bacterium]